MQATLDHVKLLMREIGPILDTVYEINEVGEDNWSIEFEDTTEIHLAWIAPTARLLASASLGKIREGREDSLMPLMLSFNLLSADNGNVRFGFSPDDGNAVLMTDFAGEQLSLTVLGAELKKFAALVVQLEIVVTSEDDAAFLPSESEPEAVDLQSLA